MVKDFLKKHKVKIVAVVSLLAFVGISLIVGDVSLGQVKDCLMSFDLDSVACAVIKPA